MASQGPLSAGAGAVDTSFGTRTWTSTEGNITASDNSRAVSQVLASGQITQYLKSSAHGFTIPAGSTIDGIVVEIERHQSAAQNVRDSRVRIVKADGSIGTTARADTTTDWPTSDTIKTYGSSSDLWGETWTPADINDADFGVVLAATNASATNSAARVDHIRITVYYTAGSAPINVPLDTSAASLAATLAASAQTQIALASSGATASTTLALAATTGIPFGAAAGVSISALSLHAESVIVLGVASSTSLATLEFQVPAGVPLETAIATATAVLAISATTGVPLAPSAGVSAATLAMSLPVDRWLPSTDIRWDADTDDRWLVTTESRW